MQAPPDRAASSSQPAAGPPASAAAPLDQLAAACLHPEEHQLALLRRILAAHSDVQLLEPVSSQAARAAELSGAELLALLRAVPTTGYAQHYEPCMQAALAAADAGDTAGALVQLARVCGEAPAVGGASGQFWQTSGTTGRAKVVAVTPSLLAEQGKLMALLQGLLGTAHPQAFSGLEIKLAFAGPARALANGWTVAVNSTAILRRMIAEKDSNPAISALTARYASPPEAASCPDYAAACHLHWLCSLAQRERVTSISDTFASQVTLACSLLWRQRAALLHDLQAGRACASWEVAELAPPGVALPPPAALDAINSLFSRLRAAAGEETWRRNADAVAQAFEAADGEAGLLGRLFPKLSLVMCVATGAMAKYAPHLRGLAPGTTLLTPGYSATEGSIGIAASLLEAVRPLPPSRTLPADAPSSTPPSSCGPCNGTVDGSSGREAAGESGGATAAQPGGSDEESFVLLPHIGCFYELLNLESGLTCSLHEADPGQRYELLLCNMMGLLRYRIGDVLQCVGFYGAAPKFTVAGRAGQALNIAAENISESLLVAAVQRAADEVLPRGCLDLQDWAAAEELHSGSSGGPGAGHHLFYWELTKAAWLRLQEATPADASAQLASWAAALQRAMCAASQFYASLCTKRMLGPAELHLVRPGAFARLREAAVKRGAAPEQCKPPAVVKRDWERQVLESCRWRA